MAITSNLNSSTATDRVSVFFSWRGPNRFTNPYGTGYARVVRVVSEKIKSQISIPLPEKVKNPEERTRYKFKVIRDSGTTELDALKLTVEQIESLSLKIVFYYQNDPQDSVEYPVKVDLPEKLQPASDYCLHVECRGLSSFSARLLKLKDPAVSLNQTTNPQTPSAQDTLLADRQLLVGILTKGLLDTMALMVIEFTKRYAKSSHIYDQKFEFELESETGTKIIEKEIEKIDRDVLQKLMFPARVLLEKIRINPSDSLENELFNLCYDVVTPEGLKNMMRGYIKAYLNEKIDVHAIYLIEQIAEEFKDACLKVTQ